MKAASSQEEVGHVRGVFDGRSEAFLPGIYCLSEPPVCTLYNKAHRLRPKGVKAISVLLLIWGKRYFQTKKGILCLGLLGLLAWAPYLNAQVSRMDFEIESIHIQPPRPDSQTPVLVHARIKNTGSEETGRFTVSVEVKQGARVVKSVKHVPVLSKLPRMGVNETLPVDVGILPEGSYEVVVMADSGNQYEEADEKDNIAKKEFHVWTPDRRSVTYGYQ